ncbi:MAG TPA: hypothetical protein VIY72_15850 [Acidimicrobiales bacterium]
MNLWRLYGDADGETHFERIALPQIDVPGEGVDRVGMLRVPSVHLTIAELGQQVPELGLHPAPARRFLTLMSGVYEITTSLGEKVRLEPGDCVFVDDVDSKGHFSDDIGDDRLTFAAVEVPDDWSL